MGNNTSNRKYTYQQYYIVIIKKNKKFDFSNIDYSILNPYEVLEVNKDFTWDELKKAYKYTALLTHPDKETGNKIIFNFVTQCFKTLAEEYKSRNANKNFFELKKDFKEQNNIDNDTPAPITGSSFNEKFNKTFDMCRLNDDINDFGYGDIMVESSIKRDDFNHSNIFNNSKFDNQTFNKHFVKNTVYPEQSKIIKYTEPEPLVLAKTIYYSEIGGKKPDDYSSSTEKNNKNNLIYTDYKLAYTNTRLINDEEISKSIKDFKNIEEYEKYRNSKIKKKLSEKEIKYFEDKKIKEEQEEYERLERIKNNDHKIKLNNEKASRLFLN